MLDDFGRTGPCCCIAGQMTKDSAFNEMMSFVNGENTINCAFRYRLNLKKLGQRSSKNGDP